MQVERKCADRRRLHFRSRGDLRPFDQRVIELEHLSVYEAARLFVQDLASYRLVEGVIGRDVLVLLDDKPDVARHRIDQELDSAGPVREIRLCRKWCMPVDGYGRFGRQRGFPAEVASEISTALFHSHVDLGRLVHDDQRLRLDLERRRRSAWSDS